jgi:hypothetical protein
MLVEAQVGENDGPLDPRTHLQRVDLGGSLREQFEARGAVGPRTEQCRHLDAGGPLRLGVLGEPGRWVDLGQGGEQPDNGGILDEEVGEPGQLRGEAVPRGDPKLGETVGDAPTEELHELGSEPLVESSRAEDRVGGLLVVGVPKGLERALELGSGFEGERVEEADGVELAVSSDEARLPGDPLDHSGREEGDERLQVVVGLGAFGEWSASALRSGLPRRMGHSIEVDRPS